MSKFSERSKNLKIYSIMKRIKLEKLFALGIIFLLLASIFLAPSSARHPKDQVNWYDKNTGDMGQTYYPTTIWYILSKPMWSAEKWGYVVKVEKYDEPGFIAYLYFLALGPITWRSWIERYIKPGLYIEVETFEYPYEKEEILDVVFWKDIILYYPLPVREMIITVLGRNPESFISKEFYKHVTLGPYNITIRDQDPRDFNLPVEVTISLNGEILSKDLIDKTEISPSSSKGAMIFKKDVKDIYIEICLERWGIHYEKYEKYWVNLYFLIHTKKIETIETTISVEDPVPFDRLFSINLRVKNLNNTVISLKITLEERTGFQAGPKYGDGDEIKEITLNPGQEAELTFKAKVYGIQRIGDVARFKFYIGDKLIEQKEKILNLKPEIVEVSTFTSPAAVKKGSSFTIGVPVFYSLSMDTVIALILINEENGKKIVISDVVKGEGLKIYSIRVNSTIADLNLEGIKSFKLTVQSEYPEENYRVAYKKEFSFKVRVSNDVGSSSIVVDSGFRIILNYGGKQYYALCAYNATPSQPSQFENIEDLFKHVYSRRNWLVFENIKGSFKPVMDDELYKTLAFAAEIAYLRATSWNNDYLVSRSKLFKELKDLAEVLETLNFIAKIAGKILGMIILKGANTWASSILAGTETTKMVYKITMIVKKFIDILKKLEFYEKVSEKFKEVAGKFEELLIRLSISYLNAASDFLIVAREKLPELTLTPYQSLVINVSDALTFYSFIQLGDTMGLAAMHFLSAFYGAEQVDIMGIKINLRPLKNALFEVLGVIPSVSSAIEFYDNLMNKFNVPEVFEIAQHMTTVWEGYELRKLICQSASLKFRDTYIRETSNSMEISLTEPGTQRKLYLTVYDTEGRIVGFNRKSGNLVAEIPNSYYLDFGNAIVIHVPLNVKIEKIVVDAIKSEQPIENYSLMIQVYKEGNLVSSTSLSSQININTKKEYSLQLTGDLKPILNEQTTTPTTPSATTFPNLELIIIIIVIAATLASLVIVFRKYKAK
jgi:hypothetical protein